MGALVDTPISVRIPAFFELGVCLALAIDAYLRSDLVCRCARCIEGSLRIFVRDPKEEIRLGPGESYAVRPGRPHLVTNGGETSATFLVLQGIGEYDYVPLT